MTGKKKLPIGIDIFEKMDREEFYYVDKTGMIEDLIQNRSEVNLFTRPRRFGKSLNMSMMKAFFEIGASPALFKGLKISERKELCEKYMGQFPVISISLKSVEGLDFEAAKKALKDILGEEAGRFYFLTQSSKLTNEEIESYKALLRVGETGDFLMSDTAMEKALLRLSLLLHKHYDKQVILLIDEYDVPLDKAFQYGYYDEMVSLLRNMFGNALKTNPNLYFAVEQPTSKGMKLLQLLNERKDKSGIVYCSTRKNVEEICDLLLSRGLPATRYHAGLDPDERRENQDDFLYDRKTIMVATNAFGMGIDKSNVSFVIHYNMPKNMESYYQEAGRAGRDGQPADCILLYSGQDVRMAEFLIERSHEAEDETIDEATRQQLIARDRERLRQMTFYCTTTECLRHYILRYFGENSPLSCGHCSSCDTNFEEVDATMDARKILSCVYRLDERGRAFGKTVVSAILTGSKNEKITQFHLDTLSTYNIMPDSTAVYVRRLIDMLLERGYLIADPDRMNVLVLARTGNALMRGRGEFRVKLPKEKKPAAAKQYAALAEDVDEKLFDALRDVRTRLAARAGVPPYVIFSNATLADMAAKQPSSEFDLLSVRGVGDAKARRYGKEFLAAIQKYRDENLGK